MNEGRTCLDAGLAHRTIELVIADVDGTLLTHDKELTAATKQAVKELEAAGLRFTLASSRPAFGLEPVAAALGVNAPMISFNGAVVVSPEFEVLEEIVIGEDAALAALAALDSSGVSAWVYDSGTWYVRDLHGPRVQHEAGVVQRQPVLVSDLAAVAAGAVKIMGVTDDPEEMAVCEAALRRAVGAAGSVARPSSFYVDVTNVRATKGTAVRRLSQLMGIERGAIAAIGDMPVDAAMFPEAGLGIAMGDAPDEVRASADAVTLGANEDGFAHAMREFVLGRGAR